MNTNRRSFLHRIAVVASGFAMFSLTTPLEAKQKKNHKKPLTKKGASAELPVVRKVTKTGLTVGEKYYEVNEFTDVIVNGEKAELSDVKPGMQASVAGGVLRSGETRADTIYKASRIVARSDNHLAKKAAQANKKAAEQARKANQRNKKSPNRR